MKETRTLMGMHITVEVIDKEITKEVIDSVFKYFEYVDETFSVYKETSEISKINRGEITHDEWSKDMKEVFTLAEQTKRQTVGFFDIKRPDGIYDPSGIVKGWAIQNAADILKKKGFKNYYVDAGGDVQTSGKNAEGKHWVIGIKSPFKENENVKIVHLSGEGIATSGTYIRGQHIYNPHEKGALEDVLSLTVIGPNIYDADRFATAAFAMGRDGILFIENIQGFEGYMIDTDGIGTETNGFAYYTHEK